MPGRGLWAPSIALLFFAISAAAFRTGLLAGTTEAVRSVGVSHGTMYETLGMTPWILVILLVAGVGITVLGRGLGRRMHHRQRHGQHRSPC